MKFDNLIEKNEKEYFENAELDERFIRQVETMGTDYYDSVISSIISVNTNNDQNRYGQIQGAGEPFQHKPLLGLYKTHCVDNSMQSMFMNMDAKTEGIKRIEDSDGVFDIDFKAKQAKKVGALLDAVIEKKGNVEDCISSYSKLVSNNLIENYKEKQLKKELKGNWLIFGKRGKKNIFLYLKVGCDHSSRGDQEIYQSLIDIYSEAFIMDLKSGK